MPRLCSAAGCRGNLPWSRELRHDTPAEHRSATAAQQRTGRASAESQSLGLPCTQSACAASAALAHCACTPLKAGQGLVQPFIRAACELGGRKGDRASRSLRTPNPRQEQPGPPVRGRSEASSPAGSVPRWVPASHSESAPGGGFWGVRGWCRMLRSKARGTKRQLKAARPATSATRDSTLLLYLGGTAALRSRSGRAFGWLST